MKITLRNIVLLAAAATLVVACSTLMIDPSSAGDTHVYLAEPLAALVARRVSLVGEMKAILDLAEKENRDLTAEEQKAFDDKKAEKAGLDTRIARLEEVAGFEASLDQVRPAASRGGGPIPPAPGPHARREFENFGEFMAAVRFNQNDPRLVFDESAGANATDLSAEMRMDNGPSGGFMVPRTFLPNILRIPPEQALVRPRASVIGADGDSPDAGIDMPALDQTGSNPANMHGGMQFSWIAEGELKPETDAKLRGVSLTPHEVAGHVVVTDKLLRNWRGSSAFLEKLMRGGIGSLEDYVFIRGDGVHKPQGAINSGAAYKVNRNTAAQVKYIDLVTMVSRFLMRGGTQPVWSMSQALLPQLATMKDENNNLIWKENAVDGFAGMLLGFPVRWNNRSPALGTLGDVLLADWSYYMIKDGSGPFIAASEHVHFLKNKTVIKIFYNVDGAPWLTAPIKEENGHEVSPFVVLDVPA